MNVVHIAAFAPVPEFERLAEAGGEVEPFAHKANPLDTPTLPPEPEMLGNVSDDHAKILNGVEVFWLLAQFETIIA